ncbi:hypothetical protein VE26_08460 [Devosia chinhatensis]|uniref:Haloacid dehalogenase n=1 Tax=Devosia chinhatensis TaxID=429727 RepID=A0A0F5FQA5_9HYPH|nr:hypothetical protein VE26_08460 [Devosia chinhatensis]
MQQRWDENLLADLGVDPERFRTEFIFDIFIKKVVIGQMSLIEALDRRLPGLGFTGSSMVFAQYWLSHDSRLNTELLDAIRRLKDSSGIRLYIATNQDHMRAQWLWQTLRLSELFEDIFYSARAGVLKPHKDFFEFAQARMGPQSEPPLFFDDTPKVIDGARAFGWDAALFETQKDFLAHPWIAQKLAP